MPRSLRFQVYVVLFCLLTSTNVLAAPPVEDQAAQLNGYRIQDLSTYDAQSFMSTGVWSASKAGEDTFYIYGGPGSQEGRFETANGFPDAQGWEGLDLTEVYPHWRASTTNAATLGNGTPNNHAVICHNDASFGIESYTGYGNSWDDWLVLRIDLSALGYDPAQDLVDLRFSLDYVHDVEADWDFFFAEWSQGGAYQALVAATGSSYVDSTGVYEAIHFDSETINLSPADYVNGEVQLRLRVATDGAGSDSDNLWGVDTQGRGAAAVDDIEVYLDEVLVSYASWEPLGTKADLPPGDITGHDNGSGLGTEGWQPTPRDFAGDFSKLIYGFQDLDPCRENRGWQYSFIDDGTPPKNDPQQRSTGGSVSSTWSYGVQGGWVVNYTGGLTNGVTPLDNRIVSPVIDWDLPGSADDGAWGCALGGDVWQHLPLTNCIFFTFEIRTWTAATNWSSWFSPGWVFFSNQPHYGSSALDATFVLPENPEKFQLRVGPVQGPWWAFCDLTDATPSPLFDNLFVMKYRLAGPLIHREFAAPPMRDHFPTDGTLDGSIRWDAWTGGGDSLTVAIEPVNAGTQLADPLHGGTMQVAMLANPEFGDHVSGARAAALQGLGAVVAGQDSRGWPIYTFAVEGQPSFYENGVRHEGWYYFDLPDGPAHPDFPHLSDEDPLFYRGDVIHYYIEAMDDLGGVSHFPADTSGFLDFESWFPYNPSFTVHGFPNGNATARPKTLVWDQNRARSRTNRLALSQAGLREGVDLDYYSGAWIAGSDGLSLEQISGYETILANEAFVDSSELELLMQWHGQEGTRQIVWMGRSRAGDLQAEPTLRGINFLNNILGVSYLSPTIRDLVGGQYSPDVAPVHDTCFSTSFNLNASCPVLEDFNHIEPTAGGAEISHEFVDRSGNSYLPAIAAGVIWPRDEMGASKSTAFFPLRLEDVWDMREDDTSIDGTSARSRVLREIFECMGMNPGAAVDAPDLPLRFEVEQNYPNPFNPSTEISYSLAARVPVELVVYDAAGRKVRTLVREAQPEGRYGVRWDATDDSGHRVASGIYLYRLKAGSFEETRKMVLLK